MLPLKAWPVLLALGAAVVAGAASDGVGTLPPRLAGYRSWTLTAKPTLLPRQLMAACAPPSLPDEVVKIHGPHGSRWVKVYANERAAAAMREDDLEEFPAGSIIVKEKLVRAMDAEAEGVAFMIKHRKGKFPASDGWEFLYYPSARKSGALDGCVACHRAGAGRDYVFGTFEPEPTDE